MCALPPEELQNNDKVKTGRIPILAKRGFLNFHFESAPPNTLILFCRIKKVRREILGLGNNLEDVYREQPVKALR